MPRNKSNTSSERPVAAVERALLILDAFRRGGAALTLAELSERTGLYKSTILRLTATLESGGYLLRASDGSYQIGIAPLELAQNFRSGVRQPEVIMQALKRLASLTGESASYVVRHNDSRIMIHRVDTAHPIRDNGRVGDVAPLNRGAAGRIFIAFSELDDPAFEDVRRRLIAVTHGELGVGMTGIAAPVFDSEGGVQGVIALTGPDARFGDEALEEMEKPLLQVARDATRQLGGLTERFEALSL